MNQRKFHQQLDKITFREAVSIFVEESGISQKLLAADLGISYSYLQRKLNINDTEARISVDEVFPIITICCGRTPQTPPLPLLWLANRLGFDVLPFGHAEPDAPTTDRECLQTNQLVAEAHKLMLDGEATPTEVYSAVKKAQNDLDQDATSYHRDWNRAHGLPDNHGIPGCKEDNAPEHSRFMTFGDITISIGGTK